MSDSIDSLMESASGLLAQMDYLGCEAACLEALGLARRAGKWADYGRILMPLQESRRQRRMIAAEGMIRLGTTDLEGGPVEWIKRLAPGCVVVTRPHGAKEARELREVAIERRLYVEVLWAENYAGAKEWVIRSFAGFEASVTVAAPPADWVDRWLPAMGRRVDEKKDRIEIEKGAKGSKQAADWFIDATEVLGDAILAKINLPLGSEERVRELEKALEAMTDHEILHQRLGDAARAMAVSVTR